MSRPNNIDVFRACDLIPESGREQVRTDLVNFIEASGRKSHAGIASHPGPTFVIAAAAFLAAAFLAGIFFLRLSSDVTWIREYTADNETKEVTLPDYSTVLLNSRSEIFYPEHFKGNERKVFVSGEAYASISKDRRHPFVIDAEGMRISVHGTKFNLKAYRDSDLREVFLEEGSVSLSVGSKGSSIDMVPNDLVRYSVSQDMMEKYSVSPKNCLDWRTSRNLSFINMKFSDIISELERFYNRKIIVASGVATDTRYYASFINGEDIFQVLDALNTDRKMKISRIEDCILISNNK